MNNSWSTLYTFLHNLLGGKRDRTNCLLPPSRKRTNNQSDIALTQTHMAFGLVSICKFWHRTKSMEKTVEKKTVLHDH